MHRIAIIGGGPSGVSLCIQLLKSIKEAKIRNNIEITVFEKSCSIGPGLPYKSNDNCYILNLPKNIMEPIPGEKNNFSTWLESVEPKFNETLFPPRHYFGKYLNHMSNKTQQEAKQMGITIKYLTKHEVINIKKIDNRSFTVHTNKGNYKANYTILSTGHMPTNKYAEFMRYENYIHDPWNNEHYANLNTKDNIAIIGSRLTSIDIAIKLKEIGHKGKIYMISRTGLLPTVLGKEIPPYELKYLNLCELNKLTDHGSKYLDKNHFIKLFWKEISAAMGQKIDISFIKKSHHEISALNWITEEVQNSKNGKRAWQQVLFALYPTTPSIWKFFSKEDQKSFLNEYYSLFITYLAAFPIENANKIKELLTSEQLEIYGGLKTIEPQGSHFLTHLETGNIIKTKYLFNATGTSYDVSILPLYKKMLKSNLIEKHPLGGIKVNTSTHQVLTKNNITNKYLFAVGELTKGDCFLTTDFGSATNHCEKVVKYIVRELHFTEATSFHYTEEQTA